MLMRTLNFYLFFIKPSPTVYHFFFIKNELIAVGTRLDYFEQNVRNNETGGD
jgi:hypothetical protein